MQFNFIWLQRGAMEKAVKDGLAQGLEQGKELGIAEGQMEGKYTALSKEAVERLLAEL